MSLLLAAARAPGAAARPSTVADVIGSRQDLFKVDFTSATCAHLVSSLRISGYPFPKAARPRNAPRPLGAAAVTLNAGTNDEACADGSLDFTGNVDTKPGSSVTPYVIFLRILEDDLPEELYDYSFGGVSKCRTTASIPVGNFTIASLTLFTPASNASAVSVGSAEAGRSKLQVIPLAENVLYGAVEFDLSNVTEAELAAFPDGTESSWQAGERPAFHCFLASDAKKANAAAKGSIDAGGSDPGGDPGLAAPDDSMYQENRKLSVGEGVAIASGVTFTGMLLASFFFRRRRLNRLAEEELDIMPTLG